MNLNIKNIAKKAGDKIIEGSKNKVSNIANAFAEDATLSVKNRITRAAGAAGAGAIGGGLVGGIYGTVSDDSTAGVGMAHGAIIGATLGAGAITLRDSTVAKAIAKRYVDETGAIAIRPPVE